MAQQFFNNATTAYLNATASASATSFTLQSGEGALFPLSAGNYFYATFGLPADNEVVKVTARSTDTFICEALASEWVAGTPVSQFVSAEMMGDMAQADGDGQVLQDHELKDYCETVATPSSSLGVLSLDLETGNVFDVTLTENITSLTFYNVPASGKGGSITLALTQDGTGGRTVTWPASVVWAGGTEPTLSSSAGAIDLITMVTLNGGSTWLAMLAGANFS